RGLPRGFLGGPVPVRRRRPRGVVQPDPAGAAFPTRRRGLAAAVRPHHPRCRGVHGDDAARVLPLGTRWPLQPHVGRARGPAVPVCARPSPALWEGEPLSLPRGVRGPPGGESLRGRALLRRRPRRLASRRPGADRTARSLDGLRAPAALRVAPGRPPLLLSWLLEAVVVRLRL